MNVASRMSDLIAARPDTMRARSEQQARRIADDVIAELAAGTLKPGDRLPDERSFCRQYGAGRHTVRKAMDVLERHGVVGRFVGRGTFVLRPKHVDASEPTIVTQNWALLELTEARLILEPEVAALAVERASAADLDRLAQALDVIGQAEEWRSFKEAKYAFHRTIAEIARNGFVCDIFDRIIASRRQTWDGYQPRPNDLAAVRATCLAESRAVLEAIVRRDASGAADAVRHSITRLLISIGGS